MGRWVQTVKWHPFGTRFSRMAPGRARGYYAHRRASAGGRYILLEVGWARRRDGAAANYGAGGRSTPDTASIMEQLLMSS